MDYPQSVYYATSSKVIGDIHSAEDQILGQLLLRSTNQKLQKENTKLRDCTFASQYQIKRGVYSIHDTTYKQQYKYIPAEVVQSSVTRRNNYFTINVGLLQGVQKGDGVLTPNGILGVVFKSSDHFSIVKTVLTKDINTDVMIGKNGLKGILKWDGINSKHGIITGVQIDLKVKKWSTVYTLGESGFFPKGIKIGKVMDISRIEGQALWEVKIKFSEDYRSLQNVYVVKNLLIEEKSNLEQLTPADN